MTGLFDAGLQPERTSLAWRRTALSIAVGSVVSMRVLPALFPHPLWYLPGTAGVVFAGWMWWACRRRFSSFIALADGAAPERPQGAGPLLALTVFVLCAGLVAGASVLLSRMEGS